MLSIHLCSYWNYFNFAEKEMQLLENVQSFLEKNNKSPSGKCIFT